MKPTAEVDVPPAPDAGEHRPRRWRALTILAVLAALLGWGAFAAVSVVTARTEMVDARRLAEDGRSALLDADVESAHLDLSDSASAFASAHRRLSSPVLVPLRAVPVVNVNVRAADRLAEAGALTASAGEAVTAVVTGFPDGVRAFVPQGGAIPIDPLVELAPALHRAGELLAQAQTLAASAPADGLVAPLADARAEFLPLVDQALDAVSTATQLVDVLPGFLGSDEPRRYFLGSANPAELRGTGGLIGAYAVLTVDRGRLAIGDFSAPYDLLNLEPEQLPAPNPDYAARYNRFGGAGFWQNINMTPDFPSAAAAIRTLYETVTGEPVDGVVVVDPVVLAGLLEITGPADLPGGGRVDAETVVAYVSNEAFAELTDPDERKLLLGAVAAGALDAFLQGDVDASPVQAIRVLGDAAGGGHLLLNSADPAIQAAFEAAGVAGRLLDPDGDYLAAVVNNAANNKVDFYADRLLHYQVDLHDDGRATATAAVELTNNAPVDGPAAYVIGPSVDGAVAGDNRSLLSVYCASGCRRTGYRRSRGNGELREETELGHPVFTTMVPLHSGESERVEVDWELDSAWEPHGDGGVYRLTVQDQPTLRPTRLVVDLTLPAGMVVTEASAGVSRSEDGAFWDGVATGTTVIEVTFAPEGPPEGEQ